MRLHPGKQASNKKMSKIKLNQIKKIKIQKGKKRNTHTYVENEGKK
jgi:hypothetical protein